MSKKSNSMLAWIVPEPFKGKIIEVHFDRFTDLNGGHVITGPEKLKGYYRFGHSVFYTYAEAKVGMHKKIDREIENLKASIKRHNRNIDEANRLIKKHTERIAAISKVKEE